MTKLGATISWYQQAVNYVVILPRVERMSIFPNDRKEDAAERQQLSDVAFEITVLEDFPSGRSKASCVDYLNQSYLATDGYRMAPDLLIA